MWCSSVCPWNPKHTWSTFYANDSYSQAQQTQGVPDGAFSWYCKEGSVLPQHSVKGFFTSGGDNNTRSALKPCHAGFYCTGDGLARPCEEGYSCEREAHTQTPCTEAGTFCRARSIHPARVLPGFSAVGRELHENKVVATRKLTLWYDVKPCASGAWCPGDGTSKPCGAGHYCVGGVRRACAKGLFGTALNETKPQCTGVCAAGYFCPEASSSAQQQECGGAHMYCPEGSGEPKHVEEAMYSVGGTANTRVSQAACEAGSYCHHGEKLVCPAGHYCPTKTAAASLHAQQCGGSDKVCKEGSAAPEVVKPGFFSVGADNATASHAEECYAGWYCGGGVAQPCEPGYSCPRGSAVQAPCVAESKSSGELRMAMRDACACVSGHLFLVLAATVSTSRTVCTQNKAYD